MTLCELIGKVAQKDGREGKGWRKSCQNLASRERRSN